MLREILRKDLIFTGLDVKDQQSLFETMGSRLEELGYVKNSYLSALSKREKIFPTGLALGKDAVAIPHTDPEHVNKNAIAIATLKTPVAFRQMATSEEEDCWVQARLILMLAIHDGNYIEVLQKVIQLIQDKGFVDRLLTVDRPEELIGIIEEKEEK